VTVSLALNAVSDECDVPEPSFNLGISALISLNTMVMDGMFEVFSGPWMMGDFLPLASDFFDLARGEDSRCAGPRLTAPQ